MRQTRARTLRNRVKRSQLRTGLLSAKPSQHYSSHQALAVPVNQRLRERMGAIKLSLSIAGNYQYTS